LLCILYVSGTGFCLLTGDGRMWLGQLMCEILCLRTGSCVGLRISNETHPKCSLLFANFDDLSKFMPKSSFHTSTLTVSMPNTFWRIVIFVLKLLVMILVSLILHRNLGTGKITKSNKIYSIVSRLVQQ
jgi:hypothetical protein